MKNTAEKSLEITSLFEAELLIQLMLRVWNHPHAADKDFANGLLEEASTALRNAIDGHQQIENVPAEDLNLVAAVWYAENCAVEMGSEDSKFINDRKAWLAAVRHALPSCFCNPSDLDHP